MNKEEMAGRPPPEKSGEDWMSLLRTLEPAEILEVLSAGEFCSGCETALRTRVLNLVRNKAEKNVEALSNNEASSEEFWSTETSTSSSSSSLGKRMVTSTDNNKQIQNNKTSSPWSRGSFFSHQIKQIREHINSSPVSVNSKPRIPDSSGADTLLSEEQKEWLRCSQVGRKKDFVHYERINGEEVNVLQGLELHTGVFNAKEQNEIVKNVYELQKMGQKGQLRARTYTEPRKWMPGKGRVTIQFGCCYNYAVDKDGNLPGIIRDEEVDPLPPIFKQMMRRLVRWRILTPTCVPNSCIVNIYDQGDCIPPHIDHHDFLRPFCTVSFLTESNILFGSKLKIVAPGEFSGPVSIPLPLGSVLILNGNGADVAKHCVPAVLAKRISVTFRKMDESKIPYGFSPDPELLNIKPLVKPLSPEIPMPRFPSKVSENVNGEVSKEPNGKPVWQNDDFPPLGSLNIGKR